MIHSFQQIAELLKRLGSLRLKYPNLKYSISKSINHQTTIILYNQNNAVDDADFDFSILSQNPYPSIDLRWIGQDEYELDTAYFDKIFENKVPFEGYTRRLDNAMNKYPPIKVAGVAPVVSFYSYKGGVGRTTTLAAFASYHARSTGARVFMIDCDFEAPGFANFFGLDQQEMERKGGIVEFLTDTINLQNTDTIDKNLMDDYVHEVSRSSAGAVSGYAGEGLIQIMLAGNLSSSATMTKNTDIENSDIQTTEPIYDNIDTHIVHYLHGLARLDFANADYIGQRFALLLQAIQKNYNPDVILIDSRTGFNDIFSNVVLRVSDVLVGFFGTSIQNLPGIYNFMGTLQEILPDENEEKTAVQKSMDVFMISAMSPNPSQSLRDFKKIITASDFFNEKLNNAIATYAIGYQTELASIGTPQDGEGDILLNFTNAKNERYPSYSNGDDKYLLKELSVKVLEKKVTVKKEPIQVNPIVPVTKQTILEPIEAFLKTQGYAENQPLTQDFINNHFYFRNYLSDLFIRDTFIVRGYKGTGKTLLYKALQDSDFVERLKSTYKITENFDFYAVIDKQTLNDVKAEQNVSLENGLKALETQYTRFWKVYIWNTLVKASNYKTEISIFEPVFTLGAITWQNFTTRMDNTNMLIIEKELLAMNEILKKENRKVVLTFDYLDVFWSPNRWKDTDNPIASLFNFCNGNPFSHIYFKIFVRTDLYNALSGVTNKNALERRTIPLEWGKEELFAYFFKVVFSVTNENFINWLFLHDDNANFIIEIKTLLQSNNNQIPVDRTDILSFLVTHFFGKYYHPEFPHYGESYNWFSANIKNANDFISIRPFNVLIQESIKLVLAKYSEKNSIESIILAGRYYGDSRVRLAAGKDSFNDIAGQNGYKYLNIFARIVAERDHPSIVPLRQVKLSEHDLKILLERIDKIAHNEKLTDKQTSSDEVKNMLIETGILRAYSTIHNKQYTFAFLYKNYFKLWVKPTK